MLRVSLVMPQVPKGDRESPLCSRMDVKAYDVFPKTLGKQECFLAYITTLFGAAMVTDRL